jgi:pimeloyl-ACP methyl ester carboxylesterase
MRNLAEQLHAGGATVIALRLPGHGTAPSGLVDVQWEDMAKAVRLATVHLKNSIGDKKLYLVGFSTGGALSVNYALSSLQDPVLPVVSGIALLSPAIGLGPEAALAIWQDRLGRLLGLDKLAWNAVLPEYDPFKYNSFAINAGDLVYRLTVEIQKQIDGLSQVQLDRFPKLLAFQSLVDATVSTPELVEGLFKRLPEGEHELVLFNINRKLEVEHLLKSDPGKGLRNLLENESLPFAISVISNKNEQTFEVVIRQKTANSRIITEQETEMSWPKGIFSLSHVALPISESDSLYGGIKKSDNKNLHLGNLALRGEIGILKLTGNDMLRMRWNPFLPYIKQRITNFFNLSSPKQVTIGGKEEIDQSESNVKPLI